jgi:glycosyltransferase involved in cell wall biosynthesis
MRTATRVVAISRCVAEFLTSIAPELTDRIRVIYNGIDLEAVRAQRSAEEVRRELGVSCSVPLVGTVAQLVPWKGVELFVEAAARIAAASEARFVVVGGDLFGEHKRYAVSVRRRAEEVGLGARIHWVGWREDVPDLLSAMNVYLHMAKSEPLGRAILEAMAVGVPCVAPNACGPAEIIRSGETGLLFRPGDVEDAARAVLEVMSNPGEAQRLAAAARREVEERFTAERMAREIAEVHTELQRERDAGSV